MSYQYLSHRLSWIPTSLNLRVRFNAYNYWAFWELARGQRRGRESTSPNGDVLSLAPQVGLEPTTHTVRNMVALLAWSASQFFLFLPAQHLPSSAAGSGKRQASYQPRCSCFAGELVRGQRIDIESTPPNGDVLSLAPQVGLEPTTLRLLYYIVFT